MFIVFLTNRKDYEPFLADVVFYLTDCGILVLLATDFTDSFDWAQDR